MRKLSDKAEEDAIKVCVFLENISPYEANAFGRSLALVNMSKAHASTHGQS